MKTKLKTPTMYASGYSLDLYCDHENDAHPKGPVYPMRMKEFFGETFADCARQARAAGWKVRKKTRTATCPCCTGK